MSFDELWLWIQRAHDEDWVLTKRGCGIKASPPVLFIHLVEEIGEMAKALTVKDNDLEEISDAMVVLMHYAIAMGFSEKDVLNQMTKKLTENIKPPRSRGIDEPADSR